MTSSLSHHIEALLFSEGGSLTKSRLAQMAQCTPEALAGALAELGERLQGGLALVETETSVALTVSAQSADVVRSAQEAELGKEIGDAGLEVLAVILYRGHSTRAQIDHIRGVNTSSTIRTLLSRGLIERAGNPADSREYLYRPTVELLAHLGASTAQNLPEYAKISDELASFERGEGLFTEPYGNNTNDANADGA